MVVEVRHERDCNFREKSQESQGKGNAFLPILLSTSSDIQWEHLMQGKGRYIKYNCDVHVYYNSSPTQARPIRWYVACGILGGFWSGSTPSIKSLTIMNNFVLTTVGSAYFSVTVIW